MFANVTSYIALRYMRARGGNHFFSWISILSILGVAIGVAAMIVVLSVINGFEKELRDRFLAANAHIMAYRFPSGLKNHEKWQANIQEHFGDVITGVAPFIHADTMCSNGSSKHSILIKGMLPAQRAAVQEMGNIVKPTEALALLQQEADQFIATGKLPTTPGIIVGRGLLSLLGAQVGDTIDIVAPNVSGQGDEIIRAIEPYLVVGVYDSGLQHYDNKLGIVSLPAAQSLFTMGDLVTGIEIGLKDPEQSKKIAQKMSDRYDISVKEWQSYNRNIFEAMKSERTVIGFIVALVAFVASFNILTTLFVAVSLKQREISLLKALGASNRMVMAVFLKQGLFMGGTGAALGAVIAWVLSEILSRYPLIRLPDIYLLTQLPVVVQPGLYAAIAGVAVAIATLAGVYPAWMATKVGVTEGLQK